MAQMTKLALAQSLKQLMAERTLDKITVKEIVTRCGVNRQTFYYHFKDIYDLLDWMFVNEGQEFSRRFPDTKTNDDGESATRNMCTYLKENKQVVINIYHSLGRELLDRYLCREMATLLYATLKYRSQVIGVKEEDLAYLIAFYKHAFAGSILDWVHDGLSGSIDDIVQKMVPILQGSFDAALKRMAASR